MNEGYVAERFIHAAETDRRLPKVGGPKRLTAIPLAYVHSEEDKKGWDERVRQKPTHLHGDPQDRRQPPSAAEISALDECAGWIADYVSDERQRRALWAWAISKAGGGSFKAWCFRTERIHPETGRRRKDRAISRISSALASKGLLHNEMPPFGVLPEEADQAYFKPTIGEYAQTANRPSWKDDLSLAPVFDESMRDTSWAEEQNERRRRKAERSKAA